MSTAIAKNFQVGSDSTATNNFTIRQPATPDGTVRIANGNSGTTTDLVTVTSAGNVGVGTTSPGGTLHLVASSANFLMNQYSADSLGSAAALAKSRGTIASPSAVLTGDSLALFSGGGYNTSSIVYNKAAVQMYAAENWTTTANGSYMTFATTAIGATSRAEAMRLDSSGNLGLGVTPSAWGSDTRALQIFNRTSLSDLQSTTQLTNNGIWNGTNWVYRETAAAGNYNINGNSHVWRIAPSGTAGNAISFTQAMTLTAGGDLGVGTTSPGARLHAVSTNEPARFAATSPTSLYVGYFYNTSTLCGYIGNGSGIVTGGGATNFGIRAEDALLFAAGGNAERARITSAGYLLVGTTAATGDARLSVNNPDNVSGDFCFVTTLGSNCNNTSSYHYIAVTGAADKFYVYGNGNVVNTNGSYGTLSDVKLKENIVDATPKLADVMRLQVRNFNLKTEPGHKQIGFVAQEFEQVFPAMVDESPDRDEEGNQLETTTKHIKTSVLVPILVKAIQELKAELDSVKTELALLKGTA